MVTPNQSFDMLALFVSHSGTPALPYKKEMLQRAAAPPAQSQNKKQRANLNLTDTFSRAATADLWTHGWQ